MFPFDDVIMVCVYTRRKSIGNRGVDLVLSEYNHLSTDEVKCTIAATVAIDSYDQTTLQFTYFGNWTRQVYQT